MLKRWCWIGVFGFVFLLSDVSSVGAMYMMPDLIKVPIERLQRNLLRQLAKNPSNPTVHINLARLYGMAFAKKTGQMIAHSPLRMGISVKSKAYRYTAGAVYNGILLHWRASRRSYSHWGSFSKSAKGNPLQRCYPEKIRALEKAKGKVSFQLKLKRMKKNAFRVVKVAFLSSTVRDANLEQCLLSELQRMEKIPPTTRIPPKELSQKKPFVFDVFFEFTPQTFSAWYGHSRTYRLPHSNEKAKSPAVALKSAKHLHQAIKHYQRALKIAPKNPIPWLGLGWCYLQLKNKDRARTSLRKAFHLAWALEKNKRSMGLGRYGLTVEAGTLLVKLLNKKQHGGEIAQIILAVTKIRRLPRPITPIVIPLRDGQQLKDVVDYKAGVLFDLDGSGRSRRWGWIRPQAAWLVYDQHNTGKIQSGLQLFGSVTFWTFWQHGYQALTALDDNADGWLKGKELRHLALWHDRNQNGRSEVGEVQPLQAHGIIAISTKSQRHSTGIMYNPHGIQMNHGKTRPTWDVQVKSR